MNLLHDISAGDPQKNINVVIEIPEGSILKIEYRPEIGIFEVDRVEPSIFPKPVNYGFIPQTLDDDGDGLDVLVVCREPLPTGIYLQVRAIGVLNFEDDGEIDHKVVAVPVDDHDTGNEISSLGDLGERWKQKVEFHFNHYKDLKKPGTTKVVGWGNKEEAVKTVEECIVRYQKKFQK